MQKTSPNQTGLVDEAAVISVGNENASFSNLAASLAEIRKLKGVIGYILRSSTSAIIDLVQQEKIVSYAVLSTEIFESGFELAKQFSLQNVESLLVEGKTAKVLCMSVGENKISVFMDNNATHAWIIKRILL
jgi:predicted regulator of Ras-like GTPase activity (Roadblock/LC7/MglB family)